jgi:glycerol-3-phosphate dehydrogenase subunit B
VLNKNSYALLKLHFFWNRKGDVFPKFGLQFSICCVKTAGMTTPEKRFDLAIVGAGLSGLVAIWQALEKNIIFCVVADGFGASEHFSGAFDLFDPRWRGSAWHHKDFSWEEAFADFLSAHPQHPYVRLSQSESHFAGKTLASMADFFRFFQIPVLGDGREVIYAFGSAGFSKPCPFVMASQGLAASELTGFKNALVLDVPYLTDYPAKTIQRNLQTHFQNVDVVTLPIHYVNRTSPLASVASRLSAQEAVIELAQILKPSLKSAQVLFLPPIFGCENHLENFHILQGALGIRVVELLSALPSALGQRLKNLVKKKIKEKNISFFKGRATEFASDNDVIQSLVVDSSQGRVTVNAKNFLLATGKFLGGGIQHNGSFKESLFALPLASSDGFLSGRTHVTQLISAEPQDKQNFLTVGVATNPDGRPVFQNQTVYKNLKACGQVLSGFDFARERTGFGMSFVSAVSLFR